VPRRQQTGGAFLFYTRDVPNEKLTRATALGTLGAAGLIGFATFASMKATNDGNYV